MAEDGEVLDQRADGFVPTAELVVLTERASG